MFSFIPWWLTYSILVTIGFAVYLNVGWALGAYFHKSVCLCFKLNLEYDPGQPETFAGKALSGWGNFVGRGMCSGSPTIDSAIFSFLWPLLLFLSFFSWIACAVCISLVGICILIKNILWLIFAGGIAKLLGAGRA